MTLLSILLYLPFCPDHSPPLCVTVSPTCPLERLILRNADVDDFECERFVEAIKCNSSLVELDLSNNKIGSAENLNTVMPDLVTGVSVYYFVLFLFLF